MSDISEICQLEADGFTIIFECYKFNKEEQFLICKIKILFEKQFDKSPIEKQNCYLSAKDLYNLNTYFDNHITNLRIKSNDESFVFVNSELDFSLQALDGEIEENKGEFSIRFMINIGKSKKETNVYAGVEGTILMESVSIFQTSIKNLLSKKF